MILNFYSKERGECTGEFGVWFDGKSTVQTGEPWNICVNEVDRSTLENEEVMSCGGRKFEHCAYEVERDYLMETTARSLAELMEIDAVKARALTNAMHIHCEYFTY